MLRRDDLSDLWINKIKRVESISTKYRISYNKEQNSNCRLLFNVFPDFSAYSVFFRSSVCTAKNTGLGSLRFATLCSNHMLIRLLFATSSTRS